MAGTSKFELLEKMKTLQPDLPVIVGADVSSAVDAIEAVKRGAFQYVAKPFA
jgi:DNA-binding NtrC family response regulator